MTARVDAGFTAYMTAPHEWEKLIGSRVSALAELRTYLRNHIERIGGGVTVTNIEIAAINAPGWDIPYRVTFSAYMTDPRAWVEMLGSVETAETELREYVSKHVERIGSGVESSDLGLALARG